MNKTITAVEIAELAKAFDINVKALKAVIAVESSKRGFCQKTGRILIQFEPHHFERISGIEVKNKVDIQNKEWEAYEKATSINLEAAQLATSWGLGQIMGFNYKAAGYNSVQEMVTAFMASEYYQLQGMLNFIKFNKRMYDSLRKLDWDAFARLYNGPNYKKFNYHTKLDQVYKKLTKNGSIV